MEGHTLTEQHTSTLYRKTPHVLHKITHYTHGFQGTARTSKCHGHVLDSEGCHTDGRPPHSHNSRQCIKAPSELSHCHMCQTNWPVLLLAFGRPSRPFLDLPPGVPPIRQFFSLRIPLTDVMWFFLVNKHSCQSLSMPEAPLTYPRRSALKQQQHCCSPAIIQPTYASASTGTIHYPGWPDCRLLLLMAET